MKTDRRATTTTTPADIQEDEDKKTGENGKTMDKLPVEVQRLLEMADVVSTIYTFTALHHVTVTVEKLQAAVRQATGRYAADTASVRLSPDLTIYSTTYFISLRHVYRRVLTFTPPLRPAPPHPKEPSA